MEATRALAEFASTTDFSQLPPKIVHETKRLILDTVACVLGGVASDMGRTVKRYLEIVGRGDSGVTHVMGTEMRVAVTAASYAHGRLANALDADDSFLSVVHHGAPTVAAALSVADWLNLDGKQTIAAVAVGFDVGARVGISMGPPDFDPKTRDYGGGKIGGGALGILAAAAAVGHLLRLPAATMAHALGIAGTRGTLPVTKWAQAQPLPLIKLWDAGWVAEAGVGASLLAAAGLTAYPDILDGPRGLWFIEGAKACDYDLMLGELGSKWYIEDTTLKPWPSCRWTHYPLTAFESLLKEHGWAPDEIENVTVRASAVANAQRFTNPNPDGMVSCQFNHPHVIAMLALAIPPGPLWQDPAVRNRADVRTFRQRVDVELEPRALEYKQWIERGQLRRLPASVIVRARGKTFERSTDFAKGDPWTPETYLSDADLVAKFDNMTTPLVASGQLAKEHARKFVELVLDLENVSSVSDLVKLLATKTEAPAHAGHADTIMAGGDAR